MKEIQQMTEQELEEEIKEFIQHKFNNNKPYIFVSYSHKDKIKVMQKVLEWIRQGYNLIMDVHIKITRIITRSTSFRMIRWNTKIYL